MIESERSKPVTAMKRTLPTTSLCILLGGSYLVLVSASTAQTLINVDFGVGAGSAKTGLAATGTGTNDYWNLYRHYDPRFIPGTPLVANGKLEKLKLADRS